MARRDFLIRESDLDEFQHKLLRKTKNLVIGGCAGSGKSLIALWRAHDIYVNNEGSVLFVVYNQSLLRYLRKAGAVIGIPDNVFESFNHCFNWAKPSEWKWECLGWKKAQHYDYIIVDEAQDCKSEFYHAFREHSSNILFYGDDGQQLYKSEGALSLEEIRKLTGFEFEYLVYNYRLTKKIARVAQPLSNDPDFVDRCTQEGDELPYILAYSDFEEQLNLIREIIENHNLDDVAILFESTNEVMAAGAFYKKDGFNVEQKIKDHMSLDFSSTLPKVMPYQSSKGLQFETVFLFMPHNVCNTKALNSVYVAMTRCYKNLYIFYSNGLPVQMSNISPDLYRSSLSLSVEEI